MNAKDRLREEIEGHVKQYLDAGGAIEFIPPRRFVPTCYEWMLDFGWDYESWAHLGGLGHGNYVQDQVNVEEGCYFTQTAPFEGQGD